MAHRVRQQLDDFLDVLRPLADVIEGRVSAAEPPAWCVSRGWSEYLLALPDEALVEAERVGLERLLPELSGAPPSLAQLARQVDALVAPFRAALEPAPVHEAMQGVPLRKGPQVSAVLAACRRHFPAARRIVDLGAGRGHASRALAVDMDAAVVGIDRNPELIRRANELATGDDLRFTVADGEGDLQIQDGELVLGLHACGGLGDALVRHAAKARAHVLLVSCCLQKIRSTERTPLSVAARHGELVLRRSALGLTNLASFAEIGHAEAVMRGRLARHGLRLLLAARGAPVPPGEEARGIHRRKFRQGLSAVTASALTRRGLQPASAEEIERFEAAAKLEHQRIRRLSLPRAMLGRVVELAVVFDRACYLEEQGYDVHVVPLFARDVSPRNLAVVGVVPD